ncbi:MAG: hypothetical protein IJA82_01170 [Clostridia bacterium]|nr:hypothetical protein [Clostridia bacterium]
MGLFSEKRIINDERRDILCTCIVLRNGNIKISDDTYEYIGGWSSQERNGIGKEIYKKKGLSSRKDWVQDMVYEGEWKNDMRHGKGKILWENGDTYEGEWKNDEPCGKGKLTSPNGDVCEGYFENDIPRGKVKVTYNNGDTYEGEVGECGGYFGQGTLIQEGVVYQGQWTDCENATKVTCTRPNGKVEKGDVIDGVFIPYSGTKA